MRTKPSLLVGAVSALLLGASSYASSVTYNTILSGGNEASPNSSLATGQAWVTYDDAAHTLTVSVQFSGLTAGATAAHIHAATALPGVGTAGVATSVPTFPGFPTGATSGTYFDVLDLALASSFSSSYVSTHGGTLAGAESALASALAEGKAYLNIHTSVYPGGEIRGFLTVPDSTSTAPLLGAALLLLATSARTLKSPLRGDQPRPLA